MPTQDNDAFQDLIRAAQQTSQTISDAMKHASATAGETLGTALYEFVEQGTETIGAVITPIATNPLVKFATRVPGISWLMAALGQVNVDIVQQDIEVLRRTYPLDSVEALAQRVIIDSAKQAAGIGLAMNFVPPLAFMLLAVDLGAIAAVQAEMIYRIAALYGFSLTESARRGEVLAIWGLSTGSSGVMKAGLTLVELLPIIGAVVGSVGNAAMLYGLGQVACRFYEAKQRAMAESGSDRPLPQEISVISESL